MEKIIGLVVLLVMLAIAIASCTAMSQETLQYGIDAAAEVAMRQPSNAELLLQSRQTAPVDSGGSMVWLGAGFAVIVVLLLVAGIAYFVVGERWMKERRKYVNAMKRKQKAASSAMPQPTVPYLDAPQIRQVPRVQRMRELPQYSQDDPAEGYDYGY